MKRIITAVFIAALLSATSLSAQNVKATYLINGQPVENFDGSQLAGKTITSYTVNKETNVDVHVIYTSDYDGKQPAEIKIIGTKKHAADSATTIQPEVIRVDSNKIVYVLDGKVTGPVQFKGVPSSNIKNVVVIKEKDHPAFKKYAKNETDVVMIVTTKK